ncbi:hypothetical protein [Bradyrhizobium sp. ARR65]|uniref:hypothetical protein n=1 Tax=Bradyrhizobium sp. ARR65 TaxID=1040989 RepID=UPI000A815DC5|nr:hypothetical protein [Bradyrhizobium sp. ARR65]
MVVMFILIMPLVHVVWFVMTVVLTPTTFLPVARHFSSSGPELSQIPKTDSPKTILSSAS